MENFEARKETYEYMNKSVHAVSTSKIDGRWGVLPDYKTQDNAGDLTGLDFSPDPKTVAAVWTNFVEVI
jgi:hypothetical protein